MEFWCEIKGGERGYGRTLLPMLNLLIKGSQYSESVQFLSKCHGKVIVVRALHGRLTKYGVIRNIRSYDIVDVDEEGRRLVDGPQCLV